MFRVPGNALIWACRLETSAGTGTQSGCNVTLFQVRNGMGHTSTPPVVLLHVMLLRQPIKAKTFEQKQPPTTKKKTLKKERRRRRLAAARSTAAHEGGGAPPASAPPASLPSLSCLFITISLATQVTCPLAPLVTPTLWERAARMG